MRTPIPHTFAPRTPLHGPSRRSLGVRTALAILTVALLALGCGGGQKGAESPGAQSEEKRSLAEYDLARDYFYKGEPRAALDHALLAVKLDDENAKALYFTSTIYLWFCSGPEQLEGPDCRLADAESYAKRALEADKSFRDARNLLGQILILAKRYPEAIDVLEPLVRDPAYTANHLAWGNLGWAQVLAGRVDEGVVSLRNSVTEPRFCVGHFRLGMAYEKKGNLRQAEEAFTSAISVESPDCQNLQQAWAGRARVRKALGNVSGAREDLERCRSISRTTPDGRECAKALASLPRSGRSEPLPDETPGDASSRGADDDSSRPHARLSARARRVRHD